jgi:hypothetical protein
MSTDSGGFNSFFHCLIIYESINEADLKYDFDSLPNILKNNSPTLRKKKATIVRGSTKSP